MFECFGFGGYLCCVEFAAGEDLLFRRGITEVAIDGIETRQFKELGRVSLMTEVDLGVLSTPHEPSWLGYQFITGLGDNGTRRSNLKKSKGNPRRKREGHLG